MSNTNLQKVIIAIEKADQLNDPSRIFVQVKEEIVWEEAETILFSNEYASSYGPTLIEGFDKYFEKIKDKKSLSQYLLKLLNFDVDSLLYEAVQQLILHHVNFWDEKPFLQQFFSKFEGTYKNTIDDTSSDYYTGQLALEGAVMLALLKDGSNLHLKALYLLLEDFPPIPDDPTDPAFLPVKAIKLFGRYFDQYPNTENIAGKIEELQGSPNTFVSNEARFTNGLIHLYKAFQSKDQGSFLFALNQAYELFKVAALSEENRSDADLFASVTAAYITMMTSKDLKEINLAVEEAQKILLERLVSFGGTLGDSAQLEVSIVSLISKLSKVTDILRNATTWPDLPTPIEDLANLYTEIRQFSLQKGFEGKLGELSKSFVMLPNVYGSFAQIQEIKAKLETLLKNPFWKESKPEYIIEFYQKLLDQFEKPTSPKDQAATNLEEIRLAAKRDGNFTLANLIEDYQTSGQSSQETLVAIAWKYIKAQQAIANEDVWKNGPAFDITKTVSSQIGRFLRWDINSYKWKCLNDAIATLSNYLVYTFRVNSSLATHSNIKFLFSKNAEGKGQDSKESDLEGHFYEAMTILNRFVVIHQPGGLAPGRPDLILDFGQDIKFAVEIKREKKDVSRENINSNFLNQVQYYAAGTTEVSFLFVLDLTPKQTPPKDIKEYCYIDKREIPGSTIPNYVIVFIIYANRERPSDYSWQQRKTPPN